MGPHRGQWAGRVGLHLGLQVPVMARAQECLFNLIPLTRDKLFLGLAAAGVNPLDVFLLLTASAVRDFLSDK